MSRLIVLDWNRTLFDPETQSLYPETSQLLRTLSLRNTLVLISRAEGSAPAILLQQAGLINFFTEIISGREKTPQLFKDIKIKYSTPTAWVIGDKLDSEIICGNKAGFTTIRIRQGKFADTTPQSKDEQPAFEFCSLLNCLDVLSS